MQTIQIKLMHTDWVFICLHISDAYIVEMSGERTAKERQTPIREQLMSNNHNWREQIILDDIQHSKAMSISIKFEQVRYFVEYFHIF